MRQVLICKREQNKTHIFFFFLQLSKFLYLCDDAVWGVRKACADVFMPVSCVCSPQIRKKELAPLFVNLLRDQSRWVRMTAYQALGPFISTFADSQITALLHNDNGEIGTFVNTVAAAFLKINVTCNSETQILFFFFVPNCFFFSLLSHHR